MIGVGVPLGQPPLVAAVKKTAAEKAASFHFPGHNRGRAAPESVSTELIGLSAFKHDLPDLPELEIPLSQAQQQASIVFGASRTWFLVGGSSQGIHASLLATCPPGHTLILPRNSHSSVFSSMVLSGAVPKYILPDYDYRWDVSAGVTPAQVRRAILEVEMEGGNAGAVIVTSPTYEGICSDIRTISDICHSHQVPLIVDQAHGAHLGFHCSLPASALSQGADLVIQSTHKVLSSLTQSSMLHFSGVTTLVDPDTVNASLRTLQTTSPSFLLLSSLDAATHQLAQNPESVFDGAIEIAAGAKDSIRGLPGISLLDSDSLAFSGFPVIDPLRLTLGFFGLGVSSYRADEILCDRHGIVCELVGTRSITFAFNLGTCPDHVRRLVEGLEHVVSLSSSESNKSFVDNAVVSAPFADFTTTLVPREAFFARKRRVGIERCVGEVCGELICPYPPGIPVLIPGERVTLRAIEYLLDVRDKGAIISGASDPQLSSILVCNNKN